MTTQIGQNKYLIKVKSNTGGNEEQFCLTSSSAPSRDSAAVYVLRQMSNVSMPDQDPYGADKNIVILEFNGYSIASIDLLVE